MRYCSNCGTQNEADSNFCSGCGAKLDVVPEAPQAEEVVQAVQNDAQAAAPAPAPIPVPAPEQPQQPQQAYTEPQQAYAQPQQPYAQPQQPQQAYQQPYGQQAYQQPQGGYAPYQETTGQAMTPKCRTFGIIGFILGIVSTVFSWLGVLPAAGVALGFFMIACGVVGIIFCGISRKNGYFKLAKIGKIFAIIGLVLSAIFWIVGIILTASGQFYYY